MDTKNMRNVGSVSDPTDKERKADHINMAFESVIKASSLDNRFYYEPISSGHPDPSATLALKFLGKQMNWPIWVSSMTGGTDHAKTINHNLARVCGEFGFGMGLGSCRMLLEDDTRLEDFSVRHLMGPDLPLYANLGIAQVEQLLRDGSEELIAKLIDKLQADGLIIHVNPLQEWLQPEGDFIKRPPVDTIGKLIEKLPGRYIVKEVGQGMGPQSLETLMMLDIQAIEFAAHGGTNFSKLEMMRSQEEKANSYDSLSYVGHDANQMVEFANEILMRRNEQLKCDNVIISGGIKDFLDGHYLINKSNFNCVYGQASGFLRHARGDYAKLKNHVEQQIAGLQLAHSFLKVR